MAEGEDKIFTRPFIVAATINFLVFMGWQMTLTGLPLFITSIGGDAAAAGLANTLGLLSSILVRPITGVVVDYFGRKAPLVLGFSLIVVTTVCYALFPIVGVILAIRFVHGFGWGFGSTANSTVAADVISKKRFAESMGYFAMTNSLGMAVAPVITIQLVEGGYGQLMLVVSAIFTLGAVLLSIWFFARDYKQPELKRTTSFRDSVKLENMFARSAFFPSIAMCFLSTGLGSISTFLAIAGTERGVAGVSLYFVAYAIANVVFRPLAGRYTDKHGFFGISVFSCLTFAVSLVLIAFAGSTLAFIVAGVLVGLGFGSGMSAFQSMSVSIVSPDKRGAATSTFFLFMNGGLCLGAFIGGMLADPIGYDGMYLVMAGIVALGCVFFVLGGKERIGSYHSQQMQ